MKRKSSYKKRALRAGAWHVTKRLIKPIPVVGTVLTLGLAGNTIRRKGLVRGSIDVALDATPILGTAKGMLEIFIGDIISEKKRKK